MRPHAPVFVALLTLLTTSCAQTSQRLLINRCDVPATISIWSPAFADGQPIPIKYATSLDLSPPIQWKNIPDRTQTLVFVMEDADSGPPDPFLHWVIYDIPPNVTALPEALPKEKKLKVIPGAIQGKNSKRRIGYLHPAPYDQRTHHYHFQIFALDDVIDPESGKTKSEVLTEMSGHVLAKGEFVGTFK